MIFLNNQSLCFLPSLHPFIQSDPLVSKIKNQKIFDRFKREIKKWKPVKCQCRICRTFVSNLGFIE